MARVQAPLTRPDGDESTATLRAPVTLPAPGGPRHDRPSGPTAGSAWLLGLVVPAALVAAWAVASGAGWISPRILPPPGEVLDAAWRFAFGSDTRSLPGVVPFEGAGGRHVAASLRRWVVAYLLALGVGIPLGLGLGLSPWCRRLLDPLVQALRSIPVTAWLPISLAWFGLGEGSARSLVFLGAVFPVVVATADASSRVPATLVETARMLGTPRRALARRVYVPAALPGIVTGMRLGLTLGWMSVIVGELTGQREGVGAMMFAARAAVQIDQILVGMATFAVIGLLGDLLLRAMTRPLIRWSDA